MNAPSEGKECCQQSAACGYVAAVFGAFLIVAGLVWVMFSYTHPAPLGEDRAAARRKALTDLRASNADVLYSPNYVWMPGVPPANHIVRMPIDRAMELSLKLWQNPAAARSNLLSRAEKATAVPPPQVLE